MTTRQKTLAKLTALLAIPLLAYALWSPGVESTAGRFDRGENGVWCSRGWLADAGWFARTGRNPADFDQEKLVALRERLRNHGVKYVFPHLCPASPEGRLPSFDHERFEGFLTEFGDFAVLPWVGGVLGSGCRPASREWRAAFVASVVQLQSDHPRIGGVHLNIEPLPDDTPGYLELLDELRAALKPGMLLSVAAYPPPTVWHPAPEVHWSRDWFTQVASRIDQVVPMMYDTALRLEKVYIRLMTDWTHEVLDWSGGAQVLLGVPAYEDAGVGYHSPRVERLSNALRGVNAALVERAGRSQSLPQGVAIYAEWTTSAQEWAEMRSQFGAATPE